MNRDTIYFGRPPKDPNDVVRIAVRALVTREVWNRLVEASQRHGTNQSDTLRLALYRFLQSEGLGDGLAQDATFTELNRKGLV